MESLKELLIGLRDTSKVTGKEDACYLLKPECPYRGISRCGNNCILDYRAKFDKEINIVIKLDI